jgi:hypothetical protein
MTIAIRTRRAVRDLEPVAADGAGAGAPRATLPDGELAKAIKLIPGEVVAFYVAANAFLQQADPALRIVAFAIGLVVTPIALYAAARAEQHASGTLVRPPMLQYVLRTIAFAVWAIAIEPKAIGVPVDRDVAGLALLAFTLIAPLIISLTDRDPR